jgi:acetyl-CoA carboxylase / biotin carboxylase 1
LALYSIYSRGPTGRNIIFIANNINFVSGSFGPNEDDLFLATPKLAGREGIPRGYLAANSRARFGIASKVRDLLGQFRSVGSIHLTL